MFAISCLPRNLIARSSFYSLYFTSHNPLLFTSLPFVLAQAQPPHSPLQPKPSPCFSIYKQTVVTTTCAMSPRPPLKHCNTGKCRTLLFSWPGSAELYTHLHVSCCGSYSACGNYSTLQDSIS